MPERDGEDEVLAPARPGLLAEFWDSVAPRTVGLVVGVLVIQVLFIASYVGAFHHPVPHRVPIAVVAPAQVVSQVVSRLDGAPGRPVQARAVADAPTAEAQVRSGRVAGAIVVDPASTTDTVVVASGGGVALASAVEQIATAADATRHRHVKVTDVVPLQSGDGRGLTGFYLVIGWILGGYLVASILGIASDARPAGTRRAVIRLMAMAIYSVVSGLLGALVVDQWIGALRGHFLALAGVGMLLVLAAGATTLAFQVLFGVIGIGLTVLVFVVAGNPSAGGAYQPALLPGLFRVLSEVLPNGAGVEAVRRIVYFSGTGVTARLLVVCAWIVGGIAVALVGSLRYERALTTR